MGRQVVFEPTTKAGMKEAIETCPKCGSTPSDVQGSCEYICLDCEKGSIQYWRNTMGFDRGDQLDNFFRHHKDHTVSRIHERCLRKKKKEDNVTYVEKERVEFNPSDVALKFIPHVTEDEVELGKSEYPDCQDGRQHDLIKPGNQYLIKPEPDDLWKVGKSRIKEDSMHGEYCQIRTTHIDYVITRIEGPIFEIIDNK